VCEQQSSTQTITFKRTLWYVGKISSKVSKVSANPSPSFLGGSNLLEEVISKFNRRKVSRFQRKNFWFLLKRTPLPHSKYHWDASGFHTFFFNNDFGTKVMTWNYLHEMSLKYIPKKELFRRVVKITDSTTVLFEGFIEQNHL